MIATILIGTAILLYAGWVLQKKYKDLKNGRYCGCGSCSGCHNSCAGKRQ